MVNEAIDALRRDGVTRIDLTVEADNPRGLAFYTKLGFEIEGRLRRYYQRAGEPEPVDDLLMAKMFDWAPSLTRPPHGPAQLGPTTLTKEFPWTESPASAASSSRPGTPRPCGAWYQRHLSIDVQAWGGTAFPWSPGEGQPATGSTVWSVAAADSEQFAPGAAPFMINYRVADLLALVDTLRAEGCHVLDKVDVSDYGKFAWVIDPEGNKVELWEPPPGQ